MRRRAYRPQLKPDPFGSAASARPEPRKGRLDLTPLIPIVAIIAFAAVKIVRIAVNRPVSQPAEATARLEELERAVQSLQQELAETQERLDFTERLLGKAREERRIGS